MRGNATVRLNERSCVTATSRMTPQVVSDGLRRCADIISREKRRRRRRRAGGRTRLAGLSRGVEVVRSSRALARAVRRFDVASSGGGASVRRFVMMWRRFVELWRVVRFSARSRDIVICRMSRPSLVTYRRAPSRDHAERSDKARPKRHSRASPRAFPLASILLSGPLRGPSS